MFIDPDAYHYLPIFALMFVGLAIGCIMLAANALLGSKAKEQLKEHTDIYECGVPSVGNARQQFSVRYYVVGIVFLLFDVEVVFTYPWVVIYRRLLLQGPFVLFEMIAFVLILVATYVYLLKRHGLNWD